MSNFYLRAPSGGRGTTMSRGQHRQYGKNGPQHRLPPKPHPRRRKLLRWMGGICLLVAAGGALYLMLLVSAAHAAS
jgi:hypothetical protein